MKVDPFKTRTHSQPLNGVTFTKGEEYKIAAMAQILATIPDKSLIVVRNALAREILWLDQVGDWTAADSEQEEHRQAEQEAAMLTYQATYAARFVQAVA